ncbi:hypothetical protein [Treponema sp.]|uniref:hypothetical protein n=1 Tax=Treponema sp. TaxID=166 RepID=UPI00388D444C
MSFDIPNINYTVSINKNENRFEESFTPYNKQQCLEYYNNHEYPFDISNLIKSFSEQIDIKPNESKELGYVLMDSLSFISGITVSIYKDNNSRVQFHKNSVDFFEYYKLFLQDIFFDYSLLINSLNIVSIIEKNDLLDNKLNELLDFIGKKYSIIINTNDTLEAQLKLLIYNIENKYFTHLIQINLSENELSITSNFLESMKNQQLTSKFFYGKRCFCLAYKGDFCYSISGYDFNKKDPSYEKLEKLLPNPASNFSTNYCMTNENTRTYGFNDKNTHNFVMYNNYILHGDGNNSDFNNKYLQFSCCERKILSYVLPEKKSYYQYKLKFICKYKPCIDCSLALIDAANELKHGIDFKYYYLTPKEFSSVKEHIKGLIIKNTNNNTIRITNDSL